MTRLDMDVTRRYVSENDAFKEGSETEIPEDVTIEPLGSVIDPGTGDGRNPVALGP